MKDGSRERRWRQGKTQVPAGWALVRPPSWLADDLFSACVLSWYLSLCEATVLLEQGPQ